MIATRQNYRDTLRNLSDEALAAECAVRIDLTRRMRNGRDAIREQTRGAYALCWDECQRRGKPEIWTAARDLVRQENYERDRGNSEALARWNRATRTSEPTECTALFPCAPSQPEEPMANLNRVHLIGRLTRDPEVRTFANGGKVCQFGFAVTGSRTKQQDGTWQDQPCFLDCKAFNRENGRKMADLCEQYLHKGDQTYIEGHLVMEQWEDKNGGGKRSAIRVVIDDVQFLQPKPSDGNGQPSQARPSQTAARHQSSRQPLAGAPDAGDSYEPDTLPNDGGEIPF